MSHSTVADLQCDESKRSRTMLPFYVSSFVVEANVDDVAVAVVVVVVVVPAAIAVRQQPASY